MTDSVIVKFASRRVKSHVMRARKGLKHINKTVYPHSIYFQDDLTETKAKIAFEARKLKKENKILDTWVWDCKILVKDNQSRIRNIKAKKDLTVYGYIPGW